MNRRMLYNNLQYLREQAEEKAFDELKKLMNEAKPKSQLRELLIKGALNHVSRLEQMVHPKSSRGEQDGGEDDPLSTTLSDNPLFDF